MKRLLFLLFLFTWQAVAKPVKVLFVGNSYTAANNLAAMFSQLALSKGDTVQAYSVNPGGYTFELHTTYAPTLAMIDSMDWDFIVLQEQSQRPSFPQSQVEVEVYPYARALDSLIHLNNPCTETVFYMTWGRKYGDAGNCAFWPPVCTFSGMQQQLRDSYVKMGVDNSALIAPVGEAWKRSWAVDSTINLWVSDNSHPDVTGTYLAACVFYATIFRNSPVGATYLSSLSVPVATHLQQMADGTVFDSLSVWNIGTYDVVASFNASVSGSVVTVVNASANSLNYIWDFGDGTTSSSAQPTPHTYASPGIYPIMLISDNGCTADTMIQQVQISATGLTDLSPEDCIRQPAPGIFQIRCGNIRKAELFTADGRHIRELEVPLTGEMSVKVEEAGLYIAVFQTTDGRRLPFKWVNR